MTPTDQSALRNLAGDKNPNHTHRGEITNQYNGTVGMGIVENSTVRFGSRFFFYGSVLSRFPKRFINDISWIRSYAMECVAELA